MLNFIAIDNRYSRVLQSHFLVHSMYEIFKIVTRVSKLTFSTKLPTFDSFPTGLYLHDNGTRPNLSPSSFYF